MSDEANKKARELMEYCSGAWWQDGIAAIAAALREKDAEMLRLQDVALRNYKEKDVEIAKLKAENLELSHTPNRLAEVEAERDYFQGELESAREQLERAKVDRDELKRTYDKTVERLSRELEAATKQIQDTDGSTWKELNEERLKALHEMFELRQAAEQAAERQRENDADIARCCCHHVLGDDPCEASDIVIAIFAQAEVKK